MLLFLVSVFAQPQPYGIKALRQLIDGKQYALADSLIKGDIACFLAQKNFDTLIAYLPLTAEITINRKGSAPAGQRTFALIKQMERYGAGSGKMINAYRTLAEFFGKEGQYQTAYKASELALCCAEHEQPLVLRDVARCHYNLGVYADDIGDVASAAMHHREAMRIRENDKNTTGEDLYLSNNSMGAIMWYASKYDSAVLYYNRSLAAIKKMPQSALNTFYRPANIYNNIAAVYSAEGKTTEAIKAMRASIGHYKQYLSASNAAEKKESAKEGLCSAVDNLAGIYKEIGDFGKAGDLLHYSFAQKQAKLPANHPALFISQILLGQHYNAIHEYDSARRYLDIGLANFATADGPYLFWAADGWFALAMVNENTGMNIAADSCYRKAEALYEQSYQGSYDNVYMDFLRKASLFYANNGEFKDAMARAGKVYAYLQKIGEGKSLQAFYQLLNIAEVNYSGKHYKEAIRNINDALTQVRGNMALGSTMLDSVKIQAFVPKAMLIRAQSAYAMQAEKDSIFLKRLSAQLDTALNLLEQHKVLIDDPESINILIADNKSLIDFAGKIALELYNKSYSLIYLEKFINLREGGIYKRLRSRLDKEHAIRFSGVPLSVLQEEDTLKEAMRGALKNKDEGDMIQAYVKAENNWEKHLSNVRKNYPAYYHLRYASLFTSLPTLQSGLPPQTTLVRYYALDTGFAALVADAQNQTIVHLNTGGIAAKIGLLQSKTATDTTVLNALHSLYLQLWQPLEDKVKTTKVMLIPDGVLYNVGFEMLAAKKVSRFKELAESGLITRYAFAYHYSLFMLNEQQQTQPLGGNYVAFAPGFSDELKQEYLSTVKDSINIDQGYLRLLQQPGTSVLAKQLKEQLGGRVFLDDASTRSSFRVNAGNHKLIHIATHGEYNNVYPELSGLIFAKGKGNADSNRLYLADIFNCDMRSDLTLLTACESGRPGYQDGEGMVSLAHAFNFAGSKNIVTALWKIDEQSSAAITADFIRNVEQGLQTDMALRMAKIAYLKAANEEQAAPMYWAGLVMMGKPLVVHFDAPCNSLLLWAGGGLIIIVALLGLYFRKKRAQLAS